MWALATLVFGLSAVTIGAVVPRAAQSIVYVTVPCDSGSQTAFPFLASSTQSVSVLATQSTIVLPTHSVTVLTTPSSVAGSSYSARNVKLGPVSNPTSDPSDLSNIVPKSNVTLFYGSNDTTTPDSNAKISCQMKVPSVILEDILSVTTVVCSDVGVIVTFSSLDGYEKSLNEWPSSGDFILFTNHLGNCDAEFERGLFLVNALEFDESSFTVIATAEKSDFQSTAGAMQVDFGQLLGPMPTTNSTSGPYSNTTTNAKRDIDWDPTYCLNFATSLASDTTIASVAEYINVVANTATFTSNARFSGHLAYNFWRARIDTLYFDLDVAFDATLALTASIQTTASHAFTYSPASLDIAPISIPGILTLGPALDFSIGAQLSATADVTVVSHAEVSLQDGNVHVDLLNEGGTSVSGWTPTSSASASLEIDATVQVNPFVELGVELAVEFLGGLVDLSSGINANATLVNELIAIGEVDVSAAAGPNGGSKSVSTSSGVINGACEDGLEYKSNFLFGITGFVSSFYSKQLYSIEVPVFDKCWALGQL